MAEYVRLGDVCTVISGSTPKSNIPEYWDGDVIWITPAELNESSYIIRDSIRHITTKAVSDTSLRSFPAGTVILSSRAPIGKTAIAGCEMYCNQGFKNLICSSRINNKYLYCFLSCKTDYLNSLGRGATFKEISKNIVEDIIIPLPEISEQKKIAAKFEHIRNVKQNYERQRELLDELIKSRFIELFGDPVDNEMQWPTKSLEEACRVIVDCPHSTPNYTSQNTGFMCIRTSIVKKNYIIWDDIEFISEEEYNKRIQRKKPEKGDVIYTREGAILGIAAVIDKECNVALGQRAMLLSPDANQCNSIFLCNAMNCDSFLANALKGQSGSASPHINVGDIKAFKMIMPPIKLQQQFAAFVAQVDKSKFVVQKSLQELETLKKSLMQQYFG